MLAHGFMNKVLIVSGMEVSSAIARLTLVKVYVIEPMHECPTH